MELTIQCEVYNNNLYAKHNDRVKRVILKNAKNIDIRFLKDDGTIVDIETTDDKITYKKDDIIIKLNNDDVAESWYGEW